MPIYIYLSNEGPDLVAKNFGGLYQWLAAQHSWNPRQGPMKTLVLVFQVPVQVSMLMLVLGGQARVFKGKATCFGRQSEGTCKI